MSRELSISPLWIYFQTISHTVLWYPPWFINFQCRENSLSLLFGSIFRPFLIQYSGLPVAGMYRPPLRPPYRSTLSLHICLCGCYWSLVRKHNMLSSHVHSLLSLYVLITCIGQKAWMLGTPCWSYRASARVSAVSIKDANFFSIFYEPYYKPKNH